MFNSFIRRFTYSQDRSPASLSQQSGPRQMNRCRRSFPTPNAAAITSGGRLFGLAIDGMIAATWPEVDGGDGRPKRAQNSNIAGGAIMTPLRHLRDVVVAALTAVGVAAALSRVNRDPTHRPTPPRHEAVLDEVIDDVTLDVRTFRTAIDSLAAKTHAVIL